MARFNLKKGFDIKAAGKAELKITEIPAPSKVAIQPVEFRGIKAKLEVEAGSVVKIGSPLFHAKHNEALKFVSPVSGKVVEINRGERRTLLEVVIENDNTNNTEEIKTIAEKDVASVSKDQIIKSMLKGGLWPMIKQRPFNKIANPEEEPRDIFISGFDTAPLAADVNFILNGLEKEFQHGIDLLTKLTSGKIYLSTGPQAGFLSEIKNAEINTFIGPHPAGNVGVQIHHIKSVKQHQVVWTIRPSDVAMIGKSFLEGFFIPDRIIAIAGHGLNDRQYCKTILGVPLASLIKESNVNNPEVRYISGNLLTGRKIQRSGYVGFYDNLVSVIPEGPKEKKLLSWYHPGFKKRSHSKSFISSWLGKKEFEMDTLVNGGDRAFIISGDYERVLPMDIYPVYLLKSILVDDIQEMEELGILELDEEDLALCTYICPSKYDFGTVLRKGLDLIEKEG
jgi:Na+-transporting NADH:ubiquinone oxidoreductase subunit A